MATRRRVLRYAVRPPPTPVTWVVVGLNTIVFVLWQVGAVLAPLGLLMERNFLVSLDGVLDGAPWTLVTSAFSQFSLLHYLTNMLTLVMFGRDVERVVGSWSAAHLYLVGGFVASLGHLVYSAVTFDPTPALGASGAVMSVLVVSTVLFPWRLVVVLFLPMPQAMFLVLYLLSDLFGLFGGSAGIAHAAHLGGAVWGLLYVVRRRRWLSERMRRLGFGRHPLLDRGR